MMYIDPPIDPPCTGDRETWYMNRMEEVQEHLFKTMSKSEKAAFMGDLEEFMAAYDAETIGDYDD